jgi:four helix bundle protein
MIQSVKRYSDLIAWQKSMDLVEEIYKLTRSFPKEELYGLSSQLRRSAISIPSNLAEGHCPNGRREFVHHISIALGSLGEAETQIQIAARLGYLDELVSAKLLAQASEVGKIIVGLMNSLEKHAAAAS